MIAEQAHLDPRFKGFLPGGRVRVDPRGSHSRARDARGALNVRTREPRAFHDSEIELLVAIAAQVAQTIEHAKLHERAQRRVAELEALARISKPFPSRSPSRSRRGDRQDDHGVAARDGRGTRAGGREDRMAGGSLGAYAVRLPPRWKRRQIGELVCDRDTPFAGRRGAPGGNRTPRRCGARARPVSGGGVLAQEIHHRVREQPAGGRVAASRAGAWRRTSTRGNRSDSVNRVLAIAAVHDATHEHREDDVDLGELVERLRAMLVQGLVAGKDVSAELESVSLAGQRATALALVFTELFGNALEHGGNHVSITLGQRNGEVILAIADDGAGYEGETGIGLSIVRPSSETSCAASSCS